MASPPALLRSLVRHTRRQANNTAHNASFTQRLLSLSDADRAKALLDLVCTEASAVLGLKANSLEPDRPLQELGLDSLMAVGIRNKLATATGLKLPATLLFDHPTLAALAKSLLTQIDGKLVTDNLERSPHRGESEGGLLSQLLRQRCDDETQEDTWGALTAATRLRLTIEHLLPDGLTDAHDEHPVNLAKGSEPVRIVSFPPLLLPSGPLVFARLASNLQNRRDLWVIPYPGYRDGQRLPRHMEAFIASRAQHVINCVKASPFILVGYSSGGWVARVMADYLAKLGHAAVGMVELDTLSIDRVVPSMMRTLIRRSIENASMFNPVSDTALTAMTWYIQMLQEHHGTETASRSGPPTLTIPMLQVHASQSLEHARAHEWRAAASVLATTAVVVGDHESILYDQETAAVVDSWISSLTALQGVQSGPGELDAANPR